MYVKKKPNRSGTTSVVVAEKRKGKYFEHFTVGVSSDPDMINKFEEEGNQWIANEEKKRQPELDLFGEEAAALQKERAETDLFLSCIDNIMLNGTDLILDKVFDCVGFNRIEDVIFRQLVKSRLSYPASKLATVEYLKNHFDEDVSLSKIYRYLDKLSDQHHELVQDISVKHTMEVLDGEIGVLFYDVTTLHFETDTEDELRKTGFSKNGKHSNPQIILGLLVSLNGYPLAYCIHEGNKYEGHTMLPIIEKFIQKYQLKNFIVVADSGLMNNNNIEELERLGYQYIIGAKIKNETSSIKKFIVSQPKLDHKMFEIDKGNKRRLLVGYTDDRAKKDAYNRNKGLRRLEKSYRNGTLTKEHINKRGYNKFLNISKDVEVSIDYDKVNQDAAWDGLKGYLTNTKISTEQIYKAYHNLWNVELAFRIAKSKIEIRPIFHFTRKRIEAHICICFVALKIYKELDRRLKQAGIKLSINKVLNMAATVTTIQVRLPLNKKTISKTMLMKRHQAIAPLFDEKFWGTH